MRKLTAHYCVQYLKAFLNWEYENDIETLHRRFTAQFSKAHGGVISSNLSGTNTDSSYH
ncbi:MAG: hypothetical protein SCH66_09125 [Methanolobus sp.]|nr:hypothetical protein [Methanolobus sp.]